MYNLPNLLTISRIVVIPVIFMSVYIHSTLWSFIAAFLFTVAAITDYFDGYLARARNEISIFGRLLDPIADKLLVVSALLIIVANQMVSPMSYIPVMVILCREVLVSGLREFLANFKIDMPVTKLAKWKTGFQMTSLGLILAKDVPVFSTLGNFGEMLLWVAGLLTFITGYQYFQKSLDYVKSMEKKEPKKDTKKEILAKAVKETDDAKKTKALDKKEKASEVPATKKIAKKVSTKVSKKVKSASKSKAVKKTKKPN